MPLDLAVESILDCWDELQPLAGAHFAEAMGWPGKTLCMDRGLYEAATAAGTYLFCTARDESRALVGYLAFFVGRHNHCDQLTAMQDGFYLAPDQRGGWTASELLTFTDDTLHLRGVELVIHGVRTGRDWSSLLRRLGYHQAETLWERRLTQTTESRP
jgi:GNAT superfamily N-acetyltransferase